MNLFASSPDPVLSAIALADRHMKQALETTQLVSTTLRLLGCDAPYAPTGPGARPILPGELYRATHPHHPIRVWTGATRANFAWAVDHGLALADELARRFGTLHRSRPVLETARDLIGLLPDGYLLPFVVDVPAEWRPFTDMTGSPVEVYRSYLRAKYAAWGTQARWTNAERPGWA